MSDTESPTQDYQVAAGNFLSDLYNRLNDVSSEVSERNEHIEDRDQYIYSDKLERMIDVPVGHDFTPVNWLKRTVEIHKTMFMGRPFQMISTYDTKDLSVVDEESRPSVELENKKEKTLAEGRRRLIDSIIKDNGGHALFLEGAENASAVGSWIVKSYYDTTQKKVVLAPVEAVENTYVIWSRDNFRDYDAFVYAYQVSKSVAASEYGLEEDELYTSPLGSPFLFNSNPPGVQIGGNNSPRGATSNVSGQTTGEPMVTILEGTGIFQGWSYSNGAFKKVPIGKETPLNCVYVGGKVVRVITDQKKLPNYYIFPNRKERRRSWAKSDITDAAININVTYIETLSDWRTLASKVNFPKFKGFNFGLGSTMPKFKERKIQLLPLSDGQDMQVLQTGDANGIDWSRQLEELESQYVRETGISRVLFDDPSVTLNSNQALITSMKPTSDIAENKKQLWSPILAQMFTDAIRLAAAHNEELSALAEGNWDLKVQWPSVMQKEDPVFQQMLLNRWNAGTMSLQTYLEMQGETKEEIDRMRDEFYDPVTAAALGHAMAPLAQYVLGLPQNTSQFVDQSQTAPVANNQPGQQPVSQPGSGAAPVGPQGALNQVNQQSGQ